MYKNKTHININLIIKIFILLFISINKLHQYITFKYKKYNNIVFMTNRLFCHDKVSTFRLNNYKKYNNIVTYDKKKCRITKLH